MAKDFQLFALMNAASSTSIQPVEMTDEGQIKVASEISVSDLDIRDLDSSQDNVAVRQVSGAQWSVVSTPVTVRGSRQTARASATTGAETTLLSATAGSYHDLIKVVAANSSDAAVTVDIRDVSGGNIVLTFEVPANSTSGESLSVPWPQSETGNAWTFEIQGSDVSNTTVTLSALFQVV